MDLAGKGTWMSSALLAAFIVLFSPSLWADFSTRPQVIYGTDDRHEVIDVQDPRLQLIADSTVAVMARASFLQTSGDVYRLRPIESSGRENGLCSNEQFRNQASTADCSGFLLASDLVVTAGHCVATQEDCAGSLFVFGDQLSKSGQAPMEFSAREVYGCRKILKVARTRDQEDFAIVQLDRTVQGHRSLTLAQHDVAVGDPLVVIGHPLGLPTKITTNANVRDLKPGVFVANIDAFEGNSGSPVLDAQSLEVVGVLVRGESDFETLPGQQCLSSKHCKDQGCAGEDVMDRSYLQQALAELKPAFFTQNP